MAIADALTCEVGGPGQKKRDTTQRYAGTSTGILSHATEVDVPEAGPLPEQRRLTTARFRSVDAGPGRVSST
ncbi:hypothetical protein [Streptomyces cinereoruber]|uniref:hypothetical protein n=1 Tax=Streptomyces cinereoruber TaxID=67260 RepID=UPI00339116E6